MIVVRRYFINPNLHHANDSRNKRAQLEVRKLLADTPMLARAERLIRALRALAHCAKPIVDLLPVLIRVHLERLGRYAFRVAPAERVPLVSVLPHRGIDLAHRGRGEDVGALGYDIDAVFRGSGERGWDGDIVTHVTHDAVDGRVDAERLADDGVEEGKCAQFVVG